MVGRMRKQDTRARAIDIDVLKNRAEMLRMGRVMIVNADELQAVKFDFFFVQDADAGA